MADEQEEKQTLLQVNDITFFQVGHGNDYRLYQAQERRLLGDIIIDIFLEQVPDKGWWGAARLNSKLRIQLKSMPSTLFPTPEIALQATEDFLSHEQRVKDTLAEMKENKLDLKTFHQGAIRPESIDPEECFSPPSLEIDGTFFTLCHLTNTEAGYRSWVKRSMADLTFDLCITHIFWRGWRAAFRLSNAQQLVQFEPTPHQLFLTDKEAMDAMLTYSSNTESMHKLAQTLKQIEKPAIIMVTLHSETTPAKPPFRVNFEEFVWQKRTDRGDFYLSSKTRSISNNKIHVLLVETERREWIAGVQFDEHRAEVYFEKSRDRGFSTPKEALTRLHTIISFSKNDLDMLRESYRIRMLWQRKIGKYNQITSISKVEKGLGL